MVKFCVVFCIFFVAGCSTPPIVGYIADVKNVCLNPIHVSVPKYTNPLPLEKKLEQGDDAMVLQITCRDERGVLSSSSTGLKEIKKCLKNYTISVSTDNRKLSLNNEEFLKLLENAESVDAGSDIYHWIIKDVSLCP